MYISDAPRAAFSVDHLHPEDGHRSRNVDTTRFSDVESRATFRRPPSAPQPLLGG
jgi:hypothetical protein